MVIYTYEISSTLNNKVNYQKLHLEALASIVPVNSIEGIKGQIFLFVDEEMSQAEKDAMVLIIQNHDGEDASAFDNHAVSAREDKIRELNQLAMYHPILDNVSTVRYLTSIDNHINAYVRSGINTVLVEKIFMDAQVGEPHYDFLNQIVNEAGNVTYEYFISKVS